MTFYLAIVVMRFRCLTNFRMSHREISCTTSLFSPWLETTKTGFSFTFVDVLGWPIVFCLLGPSSNAIANCNAADVCFLTPCRAFPGLAYLTYLVQICRTPNFVFALQSCISKQGWSCTDEGILLVAVFVRGIRVYPECGFFSLQNTL